MAKVQCMPPASPTEIGGEALGPTCGEGQSAFGYVQSLIAFVESEGHNLGHFFPGKFFREEDMRIESESMDKSTVSVYTRYRPSAPSLIIIGALV
jgi:hypothetical protein